MKIKVIENKIDEMRPGSLSERYNVCGVAKCICKDPKNPQKHGPYTQLNYVHQGKNRTKLIRKEFIKTMKEKPASTKNLKNFRASGLLLHWNIQIFK
jgi:hypothetical protein